jgi:MFS family permease
VSDLLVVLRGRDFRKLFAVRLASQASDGAFQVGLASLVLFSPHRATTPEAVALAAVVTILPYTLIGPFAGVLLDVWPRRQVMLYANSCRAAMVVGIAALILAGAVGPLLYVAALACLSVNRFFLAGLGAALPQVVPGHELVMANAVSPTCGTAAALGGAATGYAVRMVLGATDGSDAIVLLISALGYAASAALALRMGRYLLGPSERAPLDRHSLVAAGRDVVRDLVDGGRHVRARPAAAHALAAIGAHRIGYGVMTIALALLCRNHFSDPADVDQGLGLLGRAVGATGLGIAAAAFLTPVAAARIGAWRWIGTCIALACAIQVVFVVRLDLTTLFVGAFVVGLAGQGAKICVDAVLQQSVDDGYRGRVFSFYDVVFNAAFVAAGGLSVLVLPGDGYSPAVFGVVAVLFGLTAAAYVLTERRAREQPLGSIHPADPIDPGGQVDPGDPAAPDSSALDLEDEPRLPPQVDPGSRGDHGGNAGLDRHGWSPR